MGVVSVESQSDETRAKKAESQAKKNVANLETARWACIGFREEFGHMISAFKMKMVEKVITRISMELFCDMCGKEMQKRGPVDTRKKEPRWVVVGDDFLCDVCQIKLDKEFDDNGEGRRLAFAHFQLSNRYVKAKEVFGEAGAREMMSVAYTAALKEISAVTINEILKEGDDANENPNQ